MAAKIEIEITQQNFELILDRICQILTIELAEQYNLTKNKLFKSGVWKERSIAFDKAELPAINVYFDNSEYESNTPITGFGNISYNIEIMTSAKFADQERGDTLAALKCQKLMGVIRYILQHPSYLRLDYPVTPAFIFGTKINSLRMSQPTEKDGLQTMGGLMIFSVRSNEDNGNLSAIEAEGYTTEVKIDSSDKGHKFIIDN